MKVIEMMVVVVATLAVVSAPGLVKAEDGYGCYNQVEHTCDCEATQETCSGDSFWTTLCGDFCGAPETATVVAGCLKSPENDEDALPMEPILSKCNPSGYKGVYPARNERWQHATQSCHLEEPQFGGTMRGLSPVPAPLHRRTTQDTPELDSLRRLPPCTRRALCV